jgi:hypothetical protein
MIQFEILDLPKLPNQTMYSHWRIRNNEAKKWKALVGNAVRLQKERGAKPFSKAVLTL